MPNTFAKELQWPLLAACLSLWLPFFMCLVLSRLPKLALALCFPEYVLSVVEQVAAKNYWRQSWGGFGPLIEIHRFAFKYQALTSPQPHPSICSFWPRHLYGSMKTTILAQDGMAKNIPFEQLWCLFWGQRNGASRSSCTWFVAMEDERQRRFPQKANKISPHGTEGCFLAILISAF